MTGSVDFLITHDGELISHVKSLGRTLDEVAEIREMADPPVYVWIYFEGELVAMRESEAFMQELTDPWFRLNAKVGDGTEEEE